MNVKEVIEVLEAVYPKSAACTWDNVGLLVGRNEKEVHKIYVVVDVTDERIDEAIQMQADMIISHHPLLFAPLKKITDEEFIGNRVVKLLQHDISYYAMHTNYDVLRMGVLAADKMSIQHQEALELMDAETGQGIGRIGALEEALSLHAFCERIKQVFALDTVKVFGDAKMQVQRVAVCPGSGKSVTEVAIDKKAQVLVTGDIDHHAGIDAWARGMAIIDAGHYGLEHIFIEDMVGFLKEQWNDMEIIGAEIAHPFQVV